MEALWDLAHTRLPAAYREIGREVLEDPDPEVRAAGARILGKVGADPEVAGPFLRDRLPKEDDFPEVQVAIVYAIGEIGYADARDELRDAARRFLEEDYRFVTSEVMRTFGKLEDVKALPFLLGLLRYEGKTLRGRKGPLVRASSDAEAKKIYDKKYKKFAYPKGTPETVIRWWMQDLVAAVVAITGEEFEDADGLAAWMKDHRREYGFRGRDLDPKPPVPKKPKKEPEESDRGR
jgi:hypothetical protein